MATKLITGEVVLSYPHLHEAQPGKNGQKAKFSAAVVLRPDLKDFAATKAALEAALLEAAVGKWGEAAKDMLRKKQLKWPLRDGIEKDYGEGTFFVNVRSEQRPGMVYAHAGPDGKRPAQVAVEDIREVFYAGAIVRVDLSAFSYTGDESKGVSLGLNNIQKIRDGERIDGRRKAEDAFEADLSQPPASLEDVLG